MASHLVLVLVLVLLFAAAAAATAANPTLAAAALANSTKPTAYEMLERYKFPRGILPEGVRSYTLRPDGSFEVFLSGDDCEFRVAGRYVLRYGRRIAGNARPGSIRALRGVSVKVFFVWLGIDEVDLAGGGDTLSFVVGPLRASFRLNNFAKSPRCGCGFHCGDVAAGDAAVAAS